MKRYEAPGTAMEQSGKLLKINDEDDVHVKGNARKQSFSTNIVYLKLNGATPATTIRPSAEICLNA